MAILPPTKNINNGDRFVYRCGCSSVAFLLYDDGSVECNSCGTIHQNVAEIVFKAPEMRIRHFDD